MLCADYIDEDTQNAFYEGFTQNVEVTNLFVFNIFGELIHDGVNYPGNWHDTKLALVYGLYQKLTEHTPAGLAILADTAFVNDPRKTRGRLIRSRRVNETNDIPAAAAVAAVDILQQREMPSERQSAEWGIHGVKQPFGRYKRALPSDSSRRLTLLTISCHDYQMRVRLICRNQIRTFYSRR